MIDYAHPPEPASMYLPPLDNFHTFKKCFVSYSHDNCYSTPTYGTYAEPDVASTNVYNNLLNVRDCSTRYSWRYRYVADWTEDDTVSWVLDTLRYHGISEYDNPFCSLRIPGIALRGMTREQLVWLLAHISADPIMCQETGDLLYDKLQQRLNEEMAGDASSLRYEEYDPYQHPQSQHLLDLDSVDHNNKFYAQGHIPDESYHVIQASCDSTKTGSRACSYGSDLRKARKKEVTKKRPPGRPKGTGHKGSKQRLRVSVPMFLKNLLHHPRYCPGIIRWEDYSQGKFR